MQSYSMDQAPTTKTPTRLQHPHLDPQGAPHGASLPPAVTTPYAIDGLHYEHVVPDRRVGKTFCFRPTHG